jgi:hypothetical protein
MHQELETLYQQTAWKLEAKYGGSSTAYDLFKLAISFVVLSYHCHSRAVFALMSPGRSQLCLMSLRLRTMSRMPYESRSSED